MELFNKTNGIVERNQWIRFLKAAVCLSETDNLTAANCQNACGATRISMNTHIIFSEIIHETFMAIHAYCLRKVV